MKEFCIEKFCEDLKKLRNKETQQVFAEKLNINRSTLSLLETGKQIPSLEILTAVCNLGKYDAGSYFVESTDDALIYLMGKLDASDRKKIDAVMEQIRIKEKYDILARRSRCGINR